MTKEYSYIDIFALKYLDKLRIGGKENERRNYTF